MKQPLLPQSISEKAHALRVGQASRLVDKNSRTICKISQLLEIVHRAPPECKQSCALLNKRIGNISFVQFDSDTLLTVFFLPRKIETSTQSSTTCFSQMGRCASC